MNDIYQDYFLALIIACHAIPPFIQMLNPIFYYAIIIAYTNVIFLLRSYCIRILYLYLFPTISIDIWCHNNVWYIVTTLFGLMDFNGAKLALTISTMLRRIVLYIVTIWFDMISRPVLFICLLFISTLHIHWIHIITYITKRQTLRQYAKVVLLL